MSIGRAIKETFDYLADAVAVVFTPLGDGEKNHLVGVQPFTGDIYYDES